ncbi:MAG: flavodoxin-dependent (E)-4-hydroxy-3-methylbut-2-enyl-diphosphate synthase [Thermodesulfovibrionales bacterium]|jgi:(E)-4-hydroxy-3-methylbut-2-enyl-diphosphate synthase
MLRKRRKTRVIHVGNTPIGGGNPISVQSMTKTDTRNIPLTVKQIRLLEKAGCELIRIAVPDMEAARALGKIRASVAIPVIADIHFDWRLAIEAIQQGVNGLRINPGNIGARWKVAEVVSAAAGCAVPIRIGVNAGSLSKKLLEKYGHPTPEALVQSATEHIAILEGLRFREIKVSLKASNVPTTVEAYKLFARRFSYPLHIGISEAGPAFAGTIKSSVGLGILLSEGLGDTVRVSLSTDPIEEIRVAYEILKSLGLRERGANIISCPTCGRCEIDIKGLASRVENRLKDVRKPITVAVMGCVVNGPGEAREADIGIAGGKGFGLLFKKGKVVKRVEEDELLDALMSEVGE